MIVGLLSESHGSVQRTALAAGVLKAQGCEVVIHCGDLGTEAVLTELSAAFLPAGVPVHAVMGNVDYGCLELMQFPESAGVIVRNRLAEITLGERRAAVAHGDDTRQLDTLIRSRNYDYVFTGHTHVPEDRRVGTTRVINPGAVYRAASPSVAVLNTSSDELTFLPLPVQPASSSSAHSS